MERVKCEIRAKRAGEESVLLLLADENLRPLAQTAGHPERYHPDELVALLDTAEVYVADAGGEVAGYVAVEPDAETERLLVRCLCINPAHEAQAVAHQLLDWVEGLAFNRRFARLTTSVAMADQRSLSLFERHGFVRSPGVGAHDTLVLEKVLFAD